MRCQIGLWNHTKSQDTWIWMDNSVYDWGILGTNSSKWYNDEYEFGKDCVYQRNTLSNKIWRQYRCFTKFEVHCGACATPQTRNYLFKMTAEYNYSYDNYNNGSNANDIIYFQLNGADLFGENMTSWVTNLDTSEWKIDISKTLENQTNIGPILSIIVAVPYRLDFAVGMS